MAGNGKLDIRRGTRNVLQDLLCSTVPIKKFKLSNHEVFDKKNSLSDLSCSTNIDPFQLSCYICSETENVGPFLYNEVEVMAEFGLTSSTDLDLGRCSHCSKTLQEYVKLKKRMEAIIVCIKSVIRQQKQRDNVHKTDKKEEYHSDEDTDISSKLIVALDYDLVLKVENVDEQGDDEVECVPLSPSVADNNNGDSDYDDTKPFSVEIDESSGLSSSNVKIVHNIELPTFVEPEPLSVSITPVANRRRKRPPKKMRKKRIPRRCESFNRPEDTKDINPTLIPAEPEVTSKLTTNNVDSNSINIPELEIRTKRQCRVKAEKLIQSMVEKSDIEDEIVHSEEDIVAEDELSNSNSESSCDEEVVEQNRARLKKPRKDEDPHCDICTIKFISDEQLQIHNESANHSSAIKSKRIREDGTYSYHCDKCDEHFSLYKNLVAHNVTHGGIIHCEPCDKQFSKRVRYIEHLKSIGHHKKCGGGSVQRKLKCQFCTKSFTSKKNLQTHELSHTRPIVCEICGRSFATASQLSLHKKSNFHNESNKKPHKQRRRFIAPEDKPYPCPQCDKRFADKAGRFSHRKAVHEGVRHKCDLCPKDFTMKFALNLHKKRWHNTDSNDTSGNVKKARVPRPTTQTTSYTCDVCSRTLVGKNNLARHMEVVHFVVKSSCPYCQTEFSSVEDWERHLQICESSKMTESSRCSCFFCGALFKNELLRISHHLRTHTAYPCEFCEHIFTRKDSLQQHLVSHEESKPYLCPKCGKRFRQEWNLKLHSKIVCGDDEDTRKELILERRKLHREYRQKEKPYKCELCSKGFIEERRLQFHIKKVHGGGANLSEGETE